MPTTIPTINPYTGQVAVPGQPQATFTFNMQSQLTYEANLAPELNATVGAMNTVAGEVETLRNEAQASATNAETSSIAAQGYANFQGPWSTATGTWNKGNSFDHNGRTWALLVDLADVTTVEPGTDANTWRAIVDDESVNSGDSQLAGGNIWPLSSQESAQVGQDTGAQAIEFLRDATSNSIFRLNGEASGEITALSFSGLTATIGGVGYDLSFFSNYKVGDIRDYGAIADWDGATGTDNRNAIEKALADNDIIFIRGMYGTTNFSVPSEKTIEWDDSEGTDLVALDASDPTMPLIYSEAYNIPGNNFADQRQKFINPRIDGRGIVNFCLLVRSWNSRVINPYIRGATDTDLAWHTSAKDGTALTSTFVNNRLEGGWVGVDRNTAQYNVRVIDPSNKATDMLTLNTIMSGATVRNFEYDTTAGHKFSGNHTYLAPESGQFIKGGTSFRLTENDFEDSVVFDNMLATDDVWDFGPSNVFRKDLILKFGNNGFVIQSKNNTYNRNVIHDFNSADRIFISEGDTYTDDDPFLFLPGGSSGRVRTIDCYLANPTQRRHITSEFSSSKFQWDLSPYYTYGNVPIYPINGLALGNGPKTATAIVQHDFTVDSKRTIEFDIVTGANFSETPRQLYYARIGWITRGSTGNVSRLYVQEILDGAQFTSSPALSIVNNGDGTATVEFGWEPNNTGDEFGGWSMNIQ